MFVSRSQLSSLVSTCLSVYIIFKEKGITTTTTTTEKQCTHRTMYTWNNVHIEQCTYGKWNNVPTEQQPTTTINLTDLFFTLVELRPELLHFFKVEDVEGADVPVDVKKFSNIFFSHRHDYFCFSFFPDLLQKQRQLWKIKVDLS